MIDNKQFITIEGIDGSGKSTFIPKIQKMIEERFGEVVLTREPGGTPFAEELREIILNKPMTKMTEVLLAFAARAEHLEELIIPALEKGKFVISDRFTDSTLAYQGYGKGVPIEEIHTLTKLVQKDLEPGLTLIFTVPIEVSKERLGRTGKTPDKFESQNNEFFLNAIEGYEKIAQTNPERYKLIDSSKSLEHTEQQVNAYMEEYFSKFQKQKKIDHKL